MSIQLGPYAKILKPSPTIAIKMEADKLRKEGKQLYDFGIGEMNPEIPVPSVMKDGICEAIANNQTCYAGGTGMPEVLEAVSEDLKHSFNLHYPPSSIVITPGPKDAIFKVCLGVMGCGSERRRAVVFTPVYESFVNVPVMLTGEEPIYIATEKPDFFPDAAKLDAVLSAPENSGKIGVVIVNSPNNPTGAVYPDNILRAIADVVKKHDGVSILSDEVYRTIVYDKRSGEGYTSIAHYAPDRTFFVGGISKEISGTGLRLGFIAGPEGVMEMMGNLHGNASSSMNMPVMVGFTKLLQSDRNLTIRNGIREVCQRKRDLVLGLAKQINDRLIEKQKSRGKSDKEYALIKWQPPKGAFYFFPDVTGFFGLTIPPSNDDSEGGKTIRDDQDLSLFLLGRAKVVTLPGTKFQYPGYLRLAFACVPDDTIRKGMLALGDALESLV